MFGEGSPAQASANNSACARTFSVASGCASGGYLCLANSTLTIASILARNALRFCPLGADGVATLCADATLKTHRGRGLQQALIQARLADAASRGAVLATAATMPGTVSQRNYERCGFRVAYTKMNMQRDLS